MEEVTEFVSAIAPPPRAKRTPADLLDVRQSAMRRFHDVIPTVEDLKKHATKFGSESVVETAAELGYGVDALIRLQDHCDTADAALARATNRYWKPKSRATSESRVYAILGIKPDEEEA